MKSVGTSARRCRRGAMRFEVPAGVEARIRIRTAGGTEHEFPISSLSLKGLSFRVDQRAWSFHAEQMLGRTTLRVGGHRIRGTATVSHLRPVFAGETTCGINFDPESDEDRTALIAAVEFLAERQ